MRYKTSKKSPYRSREPQIEPATPRILRAAQWLNKWKFLLSLAFNAVMILMFVIGAMGMLQFIMEECIQAQNFGHIILAQNKQWAAAWGVMKEEEPFLRANIKAIRTTWNPITGRAFRAYADAAERDLERKLSWYRYMMDEEKRAQYARRLGR